MIIGRMLRKDLLRKKLITIVVYAFIFLSALLVASGTNLIIELSNSLNVLFTRANSPHFVQMQLLFGMKPRRRSEKVPALSKNERSYLAKEGLRTRVDGSMMVAGQHN